MVLCQKCKKKKATITYSASYLNYSHGDYEMLCKECYKEKLQDTIKNCQNTLKKLNKKDGKKRT